MTADPTFPRRHGRPPRGWVNDPNGCSYVDGRYHVFFQYNPDAPVHTAIRWGHMSSSDLVRWRDEPVALVNRPGEVDALGCWSGCVVDDGGVPTAVYTAVADERHRGDVVLARSDRTLRTWRQDRRAVASPPDDPRITHVRDPYVFSAFGHRYAVLGAGHTHGGGRVLVYACDDLTAWTPLGDLLTSDDEIAAAVAPANIWECPNLVPFGDRWVLIVSLWRHGPFPLAGVRYLVGDLSADLRFRPTAGGRLDDGPCFYAPQVLRHDGRTILWGWAWELEAPGPADWAGCLTYPRELTLDGDVLVSRPVPELVGLRRRPLEVRASEPFAAAAFDCAADGPFALVLRDGRDERVVVERPGPGRILVDGSMVEVFDAGPRPHTTRAYPTATSRWVVRTAAPLRVWST
jgi:beta-fructofuranosidase